MNFTLPGRFHAVVHWRRIFYVTLWMFGRRYHVCFADRSLEGGQE